MMRLAPTFLERILEITRETAADYRVTADALLSTDRARAFTVARHETWLRIRERVKNRDQQPVEFQKIATAFGLKNHTSVMAGVRKAKARRGAVTA
jgi:chromosomal replication initiation ATPase DnaA